MKTDDVRENIEWLSALLNAYRKAKYDVVFELKAKEEVASRSVATTQVKITE